MVCALLQASIYAYHFASRVVALDHQTPPHARAPHGSGRGPPRVPGRPERDECSHISEVQHSLGGGADRRESAQQHRGYRGRQGRRPCHFHIQRQRKVSGGSCAGQGGAGLGPHLAQPVLQVSHPLHPAPHPPHILHRGRHPAHLVQRDRRRHRRGGLPRGYPAVQRNLQAGVCLVHRSGRPGRPLPRGRQQGLRAARLDDQHLPGLCGRRQALHLWGDAPVRAEVAFLCDRRRPLPYEHHQAGKRNQHLQNLDHRQPGQRHQAGPGVPQRYHQLCGDAGATAQHGTSQDHGRLQQHLLDVQAAGGTAGQGPEAHNGAVPHPAVCRRQRHVGAVQPAVAVRPEPMTACRRRHARGPRAPAGARGARRPRQGSQAPGLRCPCLSRSLCWLPFPASD